MNCISCETVTGSFVPPGGIVFEDVKWIVALRPSPVSVACLPLIILKRHCEDITDLDEEESSSLGFMMQLTARTLNEVLKPEKVHFGLYAEQVKHIHIHVLPRMSNMPIGNIPNMWRNQWLDVLHRLGLKKSYSHDVVAQYAKQLRAAYIKLTSQE